MNFLSIALELLGLIFSILAFSTFNEVKEDKTKAEQWVLGILGFVIFTVGFSVG